MYHRTGAGAHPRISEGGRRRRARCRKYGWAGGGGVGHAARLLAVRDALVDEAVLLGLRRRHDAVALHVALDLVEGLAGVLGDDVGGQFAHADDLLGLNLDVAGLPTDAARDGRLVNEDARVRQREALAL